MNDQQDSLVKTANFSDQNQGGWSITTRLEQITENLLSVISY